MRHVGVPLMLFLVLSLGIAGCLENEPEEEDETQQKNDQDETATSVIPWTLADCRAVVALIPVSADAVEAHLPEGFQAVSGADSFGLPPDLRGEAVLGLETFDCASGAGLNGTVDGIAYGAYFTAVAPPESHAVPEADTPLFKWDTLVPDEPRRTFLEDLGLPVVNGTTDLSGQQVVGEGHRFDVTLTMDGDTHRFVGTAGQPADAFRDGFYFVEHTPANDGLAAWHMRENTAPDMVTGSGIVQLASGSLPAEIVGDTTSQAFFASATTVQFTNGTIELPA